MRILRGLTALTLIICLTVSLPFGAISAYPILRPETQGTEVLSMQKALNSLGFSLSADGKYGPMTLAAVSMFQQKNQLKQDGIAGNQTLSLLFRLASTIDQGNIPPANDSTTVYPPGEGTVTTTGRFEMGSFGEEVTVLQTALNKLGFSTGRTDGVFDMGTRNAVMAFQQKNGLTADGIAGSQTLAKLYSGSAAPGTPGTPVQPTPPPVIFVPEEQPNTNARYELGSSGSGVVSLQAKLIGLGYAPGRTDGVFDAATKTALISFQSRNNLVRDGIAGPLTLSKLHSAYLPSQGEGDETVPEGSGGAPNAATALVHTGNSGDLRFRSSASVSDSRNIIGSLVNGQVVQIVSQSGIWSRILAGGKEGYVMTGFLKVSAVNPELPPIAENTPVPPPSTAIGTATVKTSNGGAVRLRSSAAVSSGNVLQAVPNGSSLEVLANTGTWAQVRFGSNTGFMMSEFLQLTVAPVPTPGPIETPPVEQDPINEEESAYERILRSGSTGEDVRRLQMRLAELSYTVTVTGSYDSATVAAVRNFQNLNGLTVDGVFGSACAAAIQSPGVRSAGSNPLTYISIRMGDKDGTDGAVSKLQRRLVELGFSLTVDGSYGTKTHDAIVAFQHQNSLNISGIADALTQSQIYASGAKKNTGSTPGIDISQGQIGGPASSSVKLLDWYSEVKPALGSATVQVYHPGSGVSFNLKMYSLGRHADAEPKTLKDTQLMNAAFGAASWNTRIVYVKLPTGVWALGSMHNYPHLSGSISDNGFGGHLCMHFLRDLEETRKLDPNYGMQNQLALRKAWKGMTGIEVD